MTIMDHYVLLKQDERGLYYAKYCVGLGADMTGLGWLVHLKMALSYSRIGDSQESCNQVRKALELDTQRRICETNVIERLELQHVFYDICAAAKYCK